MIMLPQDFLTKNSIDCIENIPSVVVRGIQKTTTQTVWAIAVALGYCPELEGKTLLLKAPHVLDPGRNGGELIPED